MEPDHGGEDDHDVDDHQNGHDGHVNQHLCRLKYLSTSNENVFTEV